MLFILKTSSIFLYLARMETAARTIQFSARFKPIKTAYNSFEPAKGSDSSLAPIIFLHGLLENMGSWGVIPQVIADGTLRRAYAYDARDHGDSEYSGGINFDLIVGDLFNFMDTINASKAVLVGHSMGGLTSIKAALKNPERIEMIFIEDMFVNKKITHEVIDGAVIFYQVVVNACSATPKELDYAEAVKYAADIALSVADNFFTRDEWINIFKFLITRNIDGEWDVKFNKKSLIHTLNNLEALRTLSTGLFNNPAYFLYGSLSPYQVRDDEENIKKHFPNAELIEFEGASHCIHLSQPEKFAKIILQRLKR